MYGTLSGCITHNLRDQDVIVYSSVTIALVGSVGGGAWSLRLAGIIERVVVLYSRKRSNILGRKLGEKGGRKNLKIGWIRKNNPLGRVFSEGPPDTLLIKPEREILRNPRRGKKNIR